MTVQAKKRSVIVNGKKTSVSMDDGTWRRIVEHARARKTTVNELVTEVRKKSGERKLSAALRATLDAVS